MMRQLVGALAFVAGYVALDWVSFIHALTPLNITPWNPAAGLALALLLLKGPRAAPLVVLGVAAADLLVRHLAAPPAFILATGVTTAFAYAVAAEVLCRVVAFDTTLPRLRDVFALTAVAVVAALIVAAIYVGLSRWVGLLDPADILTAISRYWIGDVIGIAVMVPLILVHRWSRPKLPRGKALVEALAQGGAVAGALWLIFGLVDPGYEFRLFYVLFLPMIWIGARFCLEGATIGNLLTQVGVIAGFELMGHPTSTVTTFQYLMLALATASLFLGAAVSERRRIEAMLRLRQDELAQFSRLSMAGEMAAALAHELNQPLLATIAFTRAAQRMLAGDPPDMGKAGGALDRAVAEAQRAGEIVRTLREFIGTGTANRAPESLAAMVADALALITTEAARDNLRILVAVDKSLPAVHVDRVQVQQVILNLVRNAMDAMRDSPSSREVAVRAWAVEGDRLEVEVRDSGPGVSDEMAERLFEPFNTSKASGMGLGLSICRSIVEAHGGRLWLAANGPDGAAFRFTLPGLKTGDHS